MEYELTREPERRAVEAAATAAHRRAAPVIVYYLLSKVYMTYSSYTVLSIVRILFMMMTTSE